MDVTLYEVDVVANQIRNKVDPDANIIFGSSIEEDMDGAIRVSVVATGIDADKVHRPNPTPPTPPMPGGPGPSGGRAAILVAAYPARNQPLNQQRPNLPLAVAPLPSAIMVADKRVEAAVLPAPSPPKLPGGKHLRVLQPRLKALPLPLFHLLRLLE